MNDENSEITDKFLEVLSEIFFSYAKDDKLDIYNYKVYFKYAMNFNVTSAMENEAISSFHKFDMGNKGYWTCNDFILFHANACQEKKSAIYMNLLNLGYKVV